ncbi:hypothetical protein B5P43_09020 [Bacillus sp. SRB_336]|nr:hypothetical protein B5P43_09020 [Bacillus sp. SRB_336]
MIVSYRVKNLRAIIDTGDIVLKKINVIVGRNSSGKSTILRALPLLRQSVEQATKGPVLWYGRLVDFGSFKNASRGGDIKRGVELSFSFYLPPRRIAGPRPFVQRSKLGALFVSPKSGLRGRISISLGRSETDSVGDIKKIEISIGNDLVKIIYAASGIVSEISVGSRQVILGDNRQWLVTKGQLIPGIEVVEREYVSFDEESDPVSFWEAREDPFLVEVIEAVAGLVHGNTSSERLHSMASRLAYGDSAGFYEQLLDTPGAPPAFRHNVGNLSEDSTEIQVLRRAVLLNKLSPLLRTIDEELGVFAKSVRYIEPIRATAERYYRQQDLAVDDIDSRGTNTAMFLNSLPEDELAQLQTWMTTNLGFYVHIDSSAGHVELKIEDGHGVSRNIADLGFGYSQMLPIIIQLWTGLQRKKGVDFEVVAIEQPELHLHPHYQALLADLMALTASSSRSRGRIRIVVETHSDHFVNELGTLVASGKLNARDVQVIVVQDSDDGSVVRVCNFDEDGLFDKNWPAGFFNSAS